MCEKEVQHKLCGDVDAESGFDINTPQKNDSNILTAKWVIISYVKNPIKHPTNPKLENKRKITSCSSMIEILLPEYYLSVFKIEARFQLGLLSISDGDGDGEGMEMHKNGNRILHLQSLSING